MHLYEVLDLSEDGRAMSSASHSIASVGSVDSGAFIRCDVGDTYWFAVQTVPRHEKTVVKHCELREIESFLPLHWEMHRWKNGCKVKVSQPLFPGYLFTHIAGEERIRVLSIPGVVSLVGAGRIPAPLSDFEIESLRSGLHLRTFEPHPYLVVGAKVRIRNGPLTGMSGVLVRNKNQYRVVLALDLIMRSVAVEVDIDEIEPIAPGH
jgi:transcription antitermination factor NusG